MRLLQTLATLGSLATPLFACEDHDNSTTSSAASTSFSTSSSIRLNSTTSTISSSSSFTTSFANSTTSSSISASSFANSTTSSSLSTSSYVNSTSSASSTFSTLTSSFANSTTSAASSSITSYANSTTAATITSSYVNSTSTLASISSALANSTIITSSYANATSTIAPFTNTTSSSFPTYTASANNTNSTNTTVKAGAATVQSTILVFARDSSSAYSATSGLDGYGIPYELVIVPMVGITLPTLNSSATEGNYGGIIVLSEVSYGYTSGWTSAITTDQWQAIYNYQIAFGVRLVRLDVYPTTDFGVQTAISGQGCCDTGVEQLISFSDTSAFPTANLKTGAGVSSSGLWHYPATITNSTLAKEIAQFAPGGSFTDTTTAAVINDFGNRQQMVWFTSWATDWSATSNFLMHAHIHWMTRGLFVGRRRIYFGTQVDDMHLATYLYNEGENRFRARPSDLDNHVAWQAALNARLPAGSNYRIEIGHNGNGAVEWAINNDTAGICDPNQMISYDAPADPPLEFQKVVGTGTDLWPTWATTYNWTLDCLQIDALASWFLDGTNRDHFAHLSHTFSHENLNNATLSDVRKEITFNIAWLKQMGFWTGAYFSPNGLIPPAITGLHNGDAIQAFTEGGIQYVVGDNSRPVLKNTDHEFWPLISTVASNGYAGLTIIPRWSLPIYYNCDTHNCTLNEWVNTSGGWGNFSSLLDFSKSTYTRLLLSLHHDAFMFHQANMRTTDVDSWTVGDQTANFSLLQIWVEVILQEMMRLTTWPVVSLKHDDLAKEFVKRSVLDQCSPNLSYQISDDGKTITSVTVGASGNTCDTPVPVTFPVSVSGGTQEQLGTDPLTVWTTLSGSAVTYKLDTPISI